MRHFFNELKRRHVFRVGAAYAITAWVAGQITAIVMPTFDAPMWVAKAVFFLLVLGFPLSLVLAWAYEITPEGLKPTPNDAFGHTPRPGNHRAVESIIILALLAVIMLGDTANRLRDALPWATVTASRDTRPAPRASRTPTVAMLPLVAVDTSPDTALLAEGLSVERATIIALAIQASQHCVCTGTSMYSKPARSAARVTRSNIAIDWLTSTGRAKERVSPLVGRNQPNSSECCIGPLLLVLGAKKNSAQVPLGLYLARARQRNANSAEMQ